MERNKGISVRELADALSKMVADGHGDRLVLLSSDDECNEFHEAWFKPSVFSKKDARYIDDWQLPVSKEEALKNYIIIS